MTSQDQAQAQRETLLNYKENFGKQVDDYKRSIEQTKKDMIGNVQAEIDRLSNQIQRSAEETSRVLAPQKIHQLPRQEVTGEVTLNISKDEFIQIVTDINSGMLKLFESIKIEGK